MMRSGLLPLVAFIQNPPLVQTHHDVMNLHDAEIDDSLNVILHDVRVVTGAHASPWYQPLGNDWDDSSLEGGRSRPKKS